MVYVQQEPIKEELEKFKKQEIIVPLGKDKTSKWCNSFRLVPEANGKLILCLDLARFTKH